MKPISVELVQKAIDKASEAELLSYLAVVLSWVPNPNDPNDARRKEEAQWLLNDILFSKDNKKKDAVVSSRAFLQRHSENIAARGGLS